MKSLAQHQMVGTVPTGGRVRWSSGSVEMVVVDRWQDEIVVESTKSGRRYRWQDTEYVEVLPEQAS